MLLIVPHGLLELLVELLERMPRRRVVGVAPELFEEGIGELTIVCRALAGGRRLLAGCYGLGGCEFVLLGTPEGRDVALVCELVLDEGVEEFVVKGLVPGLAGEHLAEVRAALAHDRLEADDGGALGGHRHVLGRGREPDDVGPVVGEHRLIPRDAQLQFRVGEPHPHQNVHHPRAIVVVRDGLEVLVERLDCHGFTLTAPMHICGTWDELSPESRSYLSPAARRKGAARGFPRAAPSSLTLSPCACLSSCM